MSSQPASVPVIAGSELRHQLRTPLNHIIGYGEILLEEYPVGAHELLVEKLLSEASGMVDSVQHLVGGEHRNVSATLLAELRERLNPRIASIHMYLAEIVNVISPAARPDLDKISGAANTLARMLGEGFVCDVGVQPHPMDTHAGSQGDGFAATGRILVVDDDAMNRDMLRRQLLRQQHEVDVAADGPAALQMLRARRYDIVLLDLMMPGMNGFEVLERIKPDPAFAGVAVILISALDEMDSVVRSIQAGAEDYLFKPVNPTLLRARIRSTLDKLRAEEVVRRKQRLESIGRLAAGIAHDFNNLLTGIIGHAQLLQQVLTQQEDLEMVHSIVEAGERAAELTRQLLAYSGKAMFQMKPNDLPDMIRETEGLIHASLPKKVRLEMNLAPVPAVLADQNQVQQVIVNLVLNAVEAIGTEVPGCIKVRTGVEKVAQNTHFDVMPDEMTDGSYAWVEVSDNGCGMDAATAAKMFEPFFSTKFLGRGLGLAAVAGIVRAHKALLRVTTAAGQGTAMRVCFPTIAEQPAIATVTPKEDGPYILVVDDEPVVRQIVKVALERAGRKVLLAESGQAAIDALKEHSEGVELVLLDWKMPVMDGVQTLTRLRSIRPDVKVIVSSGIAPAEAEQRLSPARVTGYLQKPYRMSELVGLVQSAVQNPLK